MIYLINDVRVLSTLDWEQRNPEITIEDFAKENGYQIVDVEVIEGKSISKDDFVKTISEDGENIYIFKEEHFQSRTSVQEAKEELQVIITWFKQNDWIPNKVTVGEWKNTDPRFIEYKKERLAKRTRQDELYKIIGV
jgi:hypothetical protein